MTEATDDSRGLLSAWRELDGALRGFFARRVPAADVDDLLQDCYLNVSRGVSSLEGRERLGAWVFRIAKNLVVDHLRRRQRELQRESAADVEEQDAAATDQPDAQRVVAGWLASFVDQLPDKYAEVLRLSELEQLTHKDIAARLELSVSGVKSRVQRGREMMRSKLEACCSFEFDRRGRIVDSQRRAPRSCDC